MYFVLWVKDPGLQLDPKSAAHGTNDWSHGLLAETKARRSGRSSVGLGSKLPQTYPGSTGLFVGQVV
ncbi:MAG: hypothetical protein ACI8TQ_002134 [Planctomycetota bacterium]|jgi:hypothetical protein